MKPGDKVICIDDRNWHYVPVIGICAGIIYTIDEIFACKCGNVYVCLSEVTRFSNMWCAKCDNTQWVRMYYYIQRFRLLDQAEDSEEEIVRKGEPLQRLSMWQVKLLSCTGMPIRPEMLSVRLLRLCIRAFALPFPVIPSMISD
jgi:hypothetical protein